MKFIICDKTKVNRTRVFYHGIPNNEYLRRKWLKVFGIDCCHYWQRVCSDHFLEENYKPGKKRFLFSNTIPQPYDQNGFPSNYATQSNDIETGYNVILPMEQNIIKKLAYYDESDCIESEFYREEHIGNAVVNNFKSPRRSSRLMRKNENMSNKNMPVTPNALPVSINEVPVLSTREDQFISPLDNEAAEQSSEEKKNNAKDNTYYISIRINCSSNSLLSITLELIEKRTSQCSKMDVCNTEDLTRDEHGFIFEMSKEVLLPRVLWRIKRLNTHNATGFYQQDYTGVIVKKVKFYNNLVPTIQIYGIRCEYKTPITTKKKLEDLLEIIDCIEECRGSFEHCIGYFYRGIDDTCICYGCQGLVKNPVIQKREVNIEAINKTIQSLENIIAERKKRILKLKRNLQDLRALKPSGILNIMKP